MFKEKLNEVLKQVWRRGHTEAQEYVQTEGMTIKEAEAEILKLVKEIVPDAQHYEADWGGMDLNDQKDEAAVYGFNKCRQAILTNLGRDK